MTIQCRREVAAIQQNILLPETRNIVSNDLHSLHFLINNYIQTMLGGNWQKYEAESSIFSVNWANNQKASLFFDPNLKHSHVAIRKMLSSLYNAIGQMKDIVSH